MRGLNPIVSIIVPIYKVERYLQQCINSICEQTYEFLQIILVDDGSPDDCGKICDINAERDSRIVVIHKENGGLSSARNAGLDVAEGEYVSFVDADDTIHPQFIEILLGLCLQYECDIAQCDYLTVAEDSIKLPINTVQSIKLYNNKQAIYKMCCTNEAAKYTIAWNKVYKKELFRDIRYPLGKIHEDEFTTYLLLWKVRKIAVINLYLYYYLQRETSIMGSAFSVKKLEALAAFKERLEFLKNKQLWEEYEGTLRTMVVLNKKYDILLKENVNDSAEVCAKLLAEREKEEETLNKLALENSKMPQNCPYPKQSKIVLYGAGYWGRIYYKWIKENQFGTVVGWVDNFWKTINGTDYPVQSVDSLFRIQFDYVLIAIKDRLIQEEVAENLMYWGIPKEKIITEVRASTI